MIFGQITTPIDYFSAMQIATPMMTDMLKEWNPSDDPVLDSFSMLMLNLQRELAARRGRFEKGYWRMLPLEDQLFAEAEANWLEESIRDVAVASRMYSLSKIEPVDKDFDDKSFIAAIQIGKETVREQTKFINAYYEEIGHRENAFLDSDMARRIVENDAVLSLVPGDLPIAQNEATLMRVRPNEQTDVFRLYAVPTQREAETLRYYRDVVGPIRGEFIESLSNVLAQCQLSSITGNQDKTKKAIPPMILYDHDVPVPSQSSWLGWFQACGVAFRKLSGAEQIRIGYWFQGNPQYIITYVPPFMPRTHEHMTGGQVVANNAGDASWSLSSRSKYHVRDSHGQIDYGIWSARTSVLGEDKHGFKSMPVLNHNFDSMDVSRMSMHESALDTLNLRSTIHDWVVGDFSKTVGFENLRGKTARTLTNGLIRPDIGGMTQAFNVFGIGDDPVILPMAAMASNWDIHFRFGDFNALITWSMAFEQQAWWFANTARGQRRPLYMHELVHRLYNIRNPGKFSHFNKGGVNTVFDLKSL